MNWKYLDPVTCFDVNCSFMNAADFLKMGRPGRALMLVPGQLVRLLIVVIAYPLLYPCEKLSVLAYKGVPDEEFDAFDERERRHSDGARLGPPAGT